jgi:uncharacterized protein (DUF885 family)
MPSDHPIYVTSSELVDELAALQPLAATYLGIAGHDDRWPDLGPEGSAATLDALRAMRRRVAELPPAVDRWDRLAVEVAESTLDEEVEHYESGDHQWNLDSMASPAQDLREVFDHMPRDEAGHWENIIRRLTSLDLVLDGYRRTLEQGRVANRAVAVRQVEAVATQCDVHASDASAFLGLRRELAAKPNAAGFAEPLDAAIATARRAYATFGRYLREDYLPSARETDAVGETEYVRHASRHLGTDIDPQETYEWGWSEVAALRSRMIEVAAQIAEGGDIAAALSVLKTDPTRSASDAETFRAEMQDRTDDALTKLGGLHFDVPDQIRTVEVKLAPPGGALGAYYVGPSEDFARPGSVWWALDGDSPVPLYDQVSTAYHEGFPGHHLQVGIQVSLAERLSRLHRLWVWKPGIGEGWALYAERLMDELGFLDKPDYVFGLLAGQMLRACRIVIDIGSHLELDIASGQPFHPGERWTFDTAVEMLEAYATLDAQYARSEVTRYLGWPGQAISYKVGERAILELRAELQQRDKADFDLRAFHRDLLEVGPVAIDVVRRYLLGAT